MKVAGTRAAKTNGDASRPVLRYRKPPPDERAVNSPPFLRLGPDRPTGLPSADAYPTLPERVPPFELRCGRYRASFACDASDLDAVLRLRFDVFNVELGEGLRESIVTCRDEDVFDAQCHHLIVRDHVGDVVGTYRLQTLEMASSRMGFYSDGEFDLWDLPPVVLQRGIELGRACIAQPHRNTRVLYMLWRGIGEYVRWNAKRYLFGCCSLGSQDPADGRQLLRELQDRDAVHREFRVRARSRFECGDMSSSPRAVHYPPLLQMYLSLGAKVCSDPALDGEFKTIDYLMLLDISTLRPEDARRFLGFSGLPS